MCRVFFVCRLNDSTIFYLAFGCNSTAGVHKSTTNLEATSKFLAPERCQASSTLRTLKYQAPLYKISSSWNCALLLVSPMGVPGSLSNNFRYFCTVSYGHTMCINTTSLRTVPSVRIRAGAKDFSLLQNIHMGSGLSSRPFHGRQVKAAWPDADHSPPARQTRQLPRAVDLKGRPLSCRS
jgi:hypothetical protein